MGSGTLAWPVPGWTKISSNYGYRIHPIYKTNRFHSGIDIPASAGTPVIAADTGNVIMATTYGGYGKTVILDHGGGVATQYSHLSSINVSVGDEVVKGAKVGGVGTTGLSTGNHLHFQIMIDGSAVNPLTNGKYNVNPK
jgi:murein DD-endopeptidase MepM/ murein hydrolase activator NlpD